MHVWRRHMMKVTVDRFVGDFAVCEKENKEMIDIEIKNLPDDVKEGDILLIEKEIITIDKAATENRKKYIENLMDELWE